MRLINTVLAYYLWERQALSWKTSRITHKLHKRIPTNTVQLYTHFRKHATELAHFFRDHKTDLSHRSS